MKSASIAIALLIATSLTACSADTQPGAVDLGAQKEAPAIPRAPAAPAAPLPSGSLEVSPHSFSLCEHPDGLIEADVTWDASAAGSRWVQIFVESPSSARKLWASKPPQGQGRTGLWVRGGSQFTLVDSDTSATLATAHVTAVTCVN